MRQLYFVAQHLWCSWPDARGAAGVVLLTEGGCEEASLMYCKTVQLWRQRRRQQQASSDDMTGIGGRQAAK